MKILVITDLYPVNSDEKNTPKTILNFVQGWEKMGHEVFVIKPNFIFNSLLRRKPYYKNGLYGNILNLNYHTPFWGDVTKKIKHSEILNNKYDAVIAHMPCGLIFANKLKLPFVAGVHISDIEVLTNPIYSIYFKTELIKAYKNAVKIACRSEVLKEKFLKLYPEFESKTFVAYSGIDSKFIISKTWKNKEKYNVITCANLIKRKNVDKIIRACDDFDNINLTVVGDGKEFNRLKKLSAKPKFLGRLEHSKVLEEMRKSDIFILPSENETFGLVYLEAMASGCVTIGLKNDGIDGIIKDGFNGYLTDLSSIKETVKRAITFDNNEILKNSYNTIINYTEEKACENYLRNLA